MTKPETWLPSSEKEAAEMVADAASRGISMTIEGGGSKSAIGTPAMSGVKLATSGLAGITAYHPQEMTISCWAGTPLREITQALSEKGQRLAFEPVDYGSILQAKGDPTIGAVAAINNSGPRRIVAGAARDSLLGIRFVNGKGEVIRSGGRVMKNVTGLDLTKLLAGSWGTLGLLTEVTFRVVPEPETQSSLLLLGLDDEEATRAMAHAMASSAEVSGAAHLPEMVARQCLGQEAATVFRVEGFTGSVADRIARLEDRFAGVAPMMSLPAEASLELWRDIANAAPYNADLRKPLWRISLTPSAAPDFVLALRMQIAADVYYDWQGGLVWLRLEDDIHEREVRAQLAGHGGGNALLVRAEESRRAGAQAFQPVHPGISRLSARIKTALDPHGVFDTGRMTLA